MATLGMIGGVRGPNDYWQSLDGSGRAHAANPAYKDYSQLYREYTFEPKPGYVPVGPRDGRMVYAAPDYMRDANGNYMPVSAADVERIASETNAIIPTREEVKNLYGQAEHLTMPTFANGIGDSAAYTSALNLEEVTGPIVHGKEFFAEGGDSAVQGGQGDDWLVYKNQGATRNDPLSRDLISAMSFLPELGVTMHVISGGQEAAGEGGARTGSTRHDHGNAADVDFYRNGKKIDWNNPDDMPIIREIVTRARANGITGIGAGDDYMGPGRFHVGFGAEAVWGANGSSANTPDWLREMVGQAPVGRRQTSEYDHSRVAGYVPNTPSSIMTGTGGDPEVVGGEEDDRIQWDFTPEEQASLYEAYMSGALTGAARQSYEDGVRAGAIVTPQPIEGVSTPYTPEERAALDEAYQSGTMPPEARQAYETAFPEAAAQAATPEPTARASSMSQAAPPENIAVAPPRAEVQDAQAAELASAPPRGNNGLDLTREYGSEAGGDLMVAAAPGVFGGRNEGVVDWPNLPGIVERGADAGLTALGALGGFGGAAAGLVGDAVELAGGNSGYADRVARDLAAVPEAFAGTPFMFPARQPRPGPTREAARAMDDVEARAEPEPPRFASTVRQGEKDVNPDAFVSALSEKDQRRFGELIRRAAKGDKAAREELRELVKYDYEAGAAAERLGIDLPVDVLGDNLEIDQIMGLLRRVDSTDEAVRWERTVNEAAQKASDILSGATTMEGTESASVAVQNALTNTINTLRSSASNVYDDIGERLPKGERLQPSASRAALARLLEDREVADLKGSSVALYGLINRESGVTYTALKDMKGELGRALRGQGPYADAQEWIVRGLYKAVDQDLTNFVDANLGREAAAQIQDAHKLWAQSKDIEDRLTSAFGDEGIKSIGGVLSRSVKQMATGDATHFRKVMEIVPEDLRGDVIMAGIQRAARTTSGPAKNEGFSPQQFVGVYQGIRNDPATMKLLHDAVGPENAMVLRDIYEVSRKITDAQKWVKNKTGASIQGYFVDGLFSRFLDSKPGRVAGPSAVGATAGAVSEMVAPGTAFLTGPTAAATFSQMNFTGRRAKVADRLFRSPEFQSMMKEAATTGTVSDRTQRRMINSPRFRDWAKANDIRDPNAWLAASIAANTANRETADAQ